MKLFGISLALLSCLTFSPRLCAQATSPQDEEKLFREAIEKQLENYTELLDLEYWQVFYLDSIMTHDYGAMMAEMKVMRESKVTNTAAYELVQDKWAEQIYNSYRKVFTDEQWQKYLKAGAARDKKARDKRAAKRQQ